MQPYEVHLKAVANLVATTAGADDAMIAATWTPTTFEEIEREFGEDITDLVDNCGDICRNDPKFGRVFIREMALLLEILHEGDSRLYAMAEKKMRSCEALLAKEATAKADDDDQDDEQELLRLLSRRISPGRRGIKLFMVQIIRSRWPDDSWIAEVSEGRLEKARQLQAERNRRGHGADLVDCLQFSDKQQLFFRDPRFVRAAGFATASAAKSASVDLESLRNDLAHGQDIARHDWAPIVRLARRVVEQVFGG